MRQKKNTSLHPTSYPLSPISYILLTVLLFCTCSKKNPPPAVAPPSPNAAATAILQTGEQPLWFQLDAQGPRLIESIEDAIFSAALIPWPLAPHIRFTLIRDKEVFMAVNGGGFLRFAPWDESVTADVAPETALYWLSGGDYWKQYTVAAFEFITEKPAVLLYRDDRFLDSGAPLPPIRVWTFSAEASTPFALDVPALNRFPASEGWDIDALRFSSDAHWYYRLEKKDIPQPEIVHFRSSNLEQEGEKISLGVFQNSAMPEHISAAPPLLRAMFDAMNIAARGAAMAVSPDFSGQRYFSVDSGGMVEILAYCRASGDNPIVLAIDTSGKGFYSTGGEHLPLTLPKLPEGFVYTAITLSGQSIIATWEEQEDFSIGAAGFMALRL